MPGHSVSQNCRWDCHINVDPSGQCRHLEIPWTYDNFSNGVKTEMSLRNRYEFFKTWHDILEIKFPKHTRITVCWNMTPCSLVERCQRFGEVWCINLQARTIYSNGSFVHIHIGLAWIPSVTGQFIRPINGHEPNIKVEAHRTLI
jgi:hypothetical protein